MAFWEAAYNGSSGGNFRIRVNVDVITQEVSNNRTLIRYSAWMEKVGSNGVRVWNLTTNYAHTNINGYNPTRAVTFDLTYIGDKCWFAQNEDYWINHDANGDANPYFGADHNADDSPYLTTAAVGGNFALPHINRYAAITSADATVITDTSIKLDWTSDVTCDYMTWWSSLIDGGAHHDAATTGTSFTKTLSGLKSGTQYDVKLAVRRADSGLWTESSTLYPTTLVQNKFFRVL